jgi:hypothetical protein
MLSGGAKEINISVSNARIVVYYFNGKTKALAGLISLSGSGSGSWTEEFTER